MTLSPVGVKKKTRIVRFMPYVFLIFKLFIMCLKNLSFIFELIKIKVKQMISKKAKYAINALVVLAKNRDKESLTTLNVAIEGNIPKKFLELILLDLKKAGYVSSKKGKAGGYFLREDPEKINLADILRLFDGPIGLLPCVTHKYYQPCEECNDEKTCPLREVIKEVRDVTVALLKNATIARLLTVEKELQQKVLMEGKGLENLQENT